MDGRDRPVMDPRDPDTLYAATWQRQRSVAAYVGGGPVGPAQVHGRRRELDSPHSRSAR